MKEIKYRGATIEPHWYMPSLYEWSHPDADLNKNDFMEGIGVCNTVKECKQDIDEYLQDK